MNFTVSQKKAPSSLQDWSSQESKKLNCIWLLVYNLSALHKSHRYKPYSLIFSNDFGVDFVRWQGKKEYRTLQHNYLMNNTSRWKYTYTLNHIDFHNKVFLMVWQFLFSGSGLNYLRHYIFQDTGILRAQISKVLGSWGIWSIFEGSYDYQAMSYQAQNILPYY